MVSESVEFGIEGDRFSGNADNFLKSTSRESTFLYQISSDNHQKDNFHGTFFD